MRYGDLDWVDRGTFESFSHLTKLKDLELRRNGSIIPSAFFHLTNLVTLRLFGCEFEGLSLLIFNLCYYIEGTIPPWFSESLTKLVKLKLFRSNIEGPLPTHISKLTNLESLDIVSNAITSVCDEIVRLERLVKLDLSFNSLSGGVFFFSLLF